MTTAEAFRAGSGFETTDFSNLIIGVGCTAVLLLAAWILISVYRGWSKGRLSADELALNSVLAILLAVLFFWLLLS
ncbi:TIGR03758 family integrating conjugative element protein [Azotobacter vinelandii]|uniref:TIGR03758 family integrating conjugative element protein n=1 Tax=Azotobacter vinelandii TaxID=354 RepID=UPI000772E91F|nr:TIGR03758 family integrating conjugative element protein [Azotobacter vinelandii]